MKLRNQLKGYLHTGASQLRGIPSRLQHSTRLHQAALPAAVLTLAVTSCSTLPTVNPTDNLCNIFSTKSSWHRAAIDMQQKWQVPLYVPMAVMFHESKFQHDAKPPRRYVLGVIPGKRRSSAYGYAQAIDSTWAAYVDQTNNFGAQRTNFYDAMDFIGWYFGKSKKLEDINKSDAYNQYLAYHEGWTGYRRASYDAKPWLIRVAGEVAQTSERYKREYQSCAASITARL